MTNVLLVTREGKCSGFPLPDGLSIYPDAIVTTPRDPTHPAIAAVFMRDGMNINGDVVYRERKFLATRDPFV